VHAVRRPRHLLPVRHGLDAVHLGRRRHRVQPAALAGPGLRIRRRHVDVQVPGVPGWAANVPRQGDGLRANEVHCQLHAPPLQAHPRCTAGSRTRVRGSGEEREYGGMRADPPLALSGLLYRNRWRCNSTASSLILRLRDVIRAHLEIALNRKNCSVFIFPKF
jgi:hypothetical protein